MIKKQNLLIASNFIAFFVLSETKGMIIKMKIYPLNIQDKMNYFSSIISTQIIHWVFAFDTKIDEEILNNAVRLCVDQEPVLGCNLIIRNHELYWEKNESFNNRVFCDLVYTKNIDADLRDFFAEQIDVENNPLIKLRIFREETDFLCIKISHVVSDASGLKECMKIISDNYCKLLLDSNFSSNVNKIYDRSQKQVLSNLDPKLISTILKQKNSVMRPSNWSFPSQGYNKDNISYCIKRIDSEQYTNIKTFTKANGVSINDFLLTAFCRSLQRNAKYPLYLPIKVQIPIDLRRYAKNERAQGICNLSGVEYLNIYITENESFINTLYNVVNHMNEIKCRMPGISSALALESLSNLSTENIRVILQTNMKKAIESKTSVPILSNCGLIDNIGIVFGQARIIDSYIVSPAMYSPGFMVGSSTFKNTLTLTVGYSTVSIEKEKIEDFINIMIDEMTDFVEVLPHN